jgi:hypothetical protein
VSNASITNGSLAVCKVPLENHEDDGSWDQLVEQVEFEHWDEAQIRDYAAKVKQNPALMSKFRSILTGRRML